MSWRPTLRIAARDARRARARSTLIVAMIALPVVALSFADIMWRTAVPDAGEHLSRELGAADASLFMYADGGAHVLQAADPSNGHFTGTGDGGVAPGRVLELELPTGTRMLVEESRTATFATAGGTANLGWTEVDAADPAMQGRWVLQDGRYPADGTEVMLTPEMLSRTGLRLGDSLTVINPSATFTVVGEVSQNGARAARTVVAPPGALIGRPAGLPADVEYPADTAFLVGAPVSWSDVQALNQQGAVVTSRAVLLDPPATTKFDEQFADINGTSFGDYLVPVLIVAMVVGLSGLIVVLLAGTAFAVGARRQARSLALLSAGGGNRRDLRRVVLGGGLVLGLVAGVLGVLVGVALAAALDQLVWNNGWLLDADLAAFDVRPLELVAVATVGVVTGVLAAVVPGRQAARIDVVAALRGRSGAARRRRRTPVIGIAMIVVGVVLTILGSGWVVTTRSSGTSQQNLVVLVLVGAAALVLLGLVVCAGSVVSLVSRIAPRLPLAGRLALRDADRHRGRTAPAVAAVLAAVSGGVAVMLYVASVDQQDRENYQPSSPAGTTTLSLTTWATDPGTGNDATVLIDPDQALAVISAAAPVESSVTVRGVACTDPSGSCASVGLVRPRANQCPIYDEEPWDTDTTPVPPVVPDDPRCQGRQTTYWAFGDLAVGGAELLDVSGYPASQAVRRVLAEGGVVVTDRLDLDTDGTVRLKYYSAETVTEQPPPGQEDTWTGPVPDKVVRVPGIYVPPEHSTAPTVVSPEALSGMDLDVSPVTLLVRTEGPVTDAQEDAANAALTRELGVQSFVQVERGYESTYGLGLLALALAAGVVTLGATGIATGLALTDARADHATLAAVGAAPGLRRRLAAAQSLVLGLLGVLLGIGAGVVPALSIIGAAPSLEVVWPWPQLVALVVGIPLLSAAFAYVFTRSRVPLQRRVVA